MAVPHFELRCHCYCLLSSSVSESTTVQPTSSGRHRDSHQSQVTYAVISQWQCQLLVHGWRWCT